MNTRLQRSILAGLLSLMLAGGIYGAMTLSEPSGERAVCGVNDLDAFYRRLPLCEATD